MTEQLHSPLSKRTRRGYLTAAATVSLAAMAGCLDGPTDSFGDEADDVTVDTVVDDLATPWALAFLSDTQTLITERDSGRLQLVDTDDETMSTIDGTPDVDAAGQGGLLDVVLHPAYPDEPWVYLTYSVATGGETATELGRGRFEPDAGALTEFETLYTADSVDSNAHYGSRIVFDTDETLYMTIGDRQSKEFGPGHFSQDLTTDIGSTLRLAADGSVPDDNPFVDDADAVDALFSYGHRNVQGMTIHPETGALWQADHGERDGDALVIVERGENHGWPIAHYGCQYGTDDPVGDEPGERDDVVDPVYFWECASGGFPPSGMTFYDGPIDDWQGDLFVGNLAGQYLGRFSVDGTAVTEREPLLADRGWRIRDVAVADGDLYVVVDADPAPLVRLTPTA